MKSFLSVLLSALLMIGIYSFTTASHVEAPVLNKTSSVPAPERIPCNSFPDFTGRKWKMDEIRFQQDNQPFYYKRGNHRESNMNFDNDWIIFNCDGSGIYHQPDGEEYKLQWQQVESKANTIIYTISNFRFNSDLVVTLENIELSGEHARYTEYYTHRNKVHSLGVVKRVGEGGGINEVASR